MKNSKREKWSSINNRSGHKVKPLFLVLALIMILSGCSKGGGSGENTGTTGQNSQTEQGTEFQDGISQNGQNDSEGQNGPLNGNIVQNGMQSGTSLMLAPETAIQALEDLVEICIKNGEYFDSLLMYESSNFWYSQAGAGVGALRLAIERILWLLGEGENFASLSQGSRITSWDELEMMCPSSPYPWYFEGLIYDVQGKADDAAYCYAGAESLLNYPDGGMDFHFLKDMPIADLYTARDRLRAIEERLYSEYEPDNTGIEPDPWNGRPDYLISQIVVLTGDEKCEEAMPYAEELVRMAPFEAVNWYSAVVTALGAGEPSYAVIWLREGLGYHPEDKSLLEMSDTIAQIFGEAE